MVLCCISQTNSGKHVTMGVLSGLLGALIIAAQVLPLLLTDASLDHQEAQVATGLLNLAIMLLLPILGSIASSVAEWTSECSCHCCAMGCVAICGIPMGVMWGIGGVVVLVISSAAHQ